MFSPSKNVLGEKEAMFFSFNETVLFIFFQETRLKRKIHFLFFVDEKDSFSWKGMFQEINQSAKGAKKVEFYLMYIFRKVCCHFFEEKKNLDLFFQTKMHPFLN